MTDRCKCSICTHCPICKTEISCWIKYDLGCEHGDNVCLNCSGKYGSCIYLDTDGQVKKRELPFTFENPPDTGWLDEMQKRLSDFRYNCQGQLTYQGEVIKKRLKKQEKKDEII